MPILILWKGLIEVGLNVFLNNEGGNGGFFLDTKVVRTDHFCIKEDLKKFGC